MSAPVKQRSMLVTRLIDIAVCTAGTAFIVALSFLLQDKGW